MIARNHPSQPPKAVVFDLGKVLLDFDYGIAARRFLPRSQTTFAVLNEAINGSSLLLDYETGRLTTAAFFERVRELTGFQGSQSEFEELFGDIFTEIQPMTALLPALRAAGIPIIAFSNTNEMAVRHIQRTYPFYGSFNAHVLSFERGMMKPDQRIYATVEEVSGRRGPELFYLDDREENVAAALERGWRAIVHRDPEDSIGHLRAAGLPVG